MEKDGNKMEKTVKSILVVIWIACCIAEASANAQCFEGDVIVTTQESFDVANQYPCINGALTMTGNYHIQNVVFQNLQSVTGVITITGRRPPADWHITFPALQDAGLVRIGANRRLQSVQFGFDIVSVYDLKVYANPNLKMVSLGSVTDIDRDLLVYENNSLILMYGIALESVGRNLEIYNNRSLPQCDAEEWLDIEADGYRIENNMDCVEAYSSRLSR